MGKRNLFGGALAALMLCLATSCATSGTGTGELVSKNGAVQQEQQPVLFTWHSSLDHLHGQMWATLPNGKSYAGQFFEITSTTQADTLTPLWEGWSPWWADWPWAAYAYAGPDFITNYSGRVLATLVANDGTRMRCRFQLANPPNGMASGGQGKCQLQNGTTIDAYFPPAK